MCEDGDVRLVDGSDVNEGIVEVCHRNEWGNVCEDMWDEVNAGVVCGQLGFSKSGMHGYFFFVLSLNDDQEMHGGSYNGYKCSCILFISEILREHPSFVFRLS